jgi:hypothetical protein
MRGRNLLKASYSNYPDTVNIFLPETDEACYPFLATKKGDRLLLLGLQLKE